jgi:phosphate transport system substrate-binding protein
MITRRICLHNVFLAGATGLVGWSGPMFGVEAEELVTLRGAGSTFSAPLYKKWMEIYQKDHKDVLLSYDAVGSGEGVSRFVAGSVDFGASDVLPGTQTFAGVTRGMIVVPATAGMIVLAFNLSGINGPLNLPRHVYSDIFAGRIKSWSDPRVQSANPTLSLPDMDIAVVVRQDSSGTTAAFTRHLVAVGSSWGTTGAGEGFLIDWPAAVMYAKGNEGVASKIKISEGSIGFVEYGFAKRLGLPIAVLENKTGRFVVPSEESGRAALIATQGDSTADPPGDESYPIVTFSWLLLYKKYWDPKRAPLLKDWIKWGLTTGQTFASDLGYIPLPSETVALAERSLDGIS